jgi:hypothetical protein
MTVLVGDELRQPHEDADVIRQQIEELDDRRCLVGSTLGDDGKAVRRQVGQRDLMQDRPGDQGVEVRRVNVDDFIIEDLSANGKGRRPPA